MSSRPNNAIEDSTSQGFGSNRIYANVKISNKPAGKWMFDTGADLSVMTQGLAKQLGVIGNAGSINLIGVGGNNSAPLATVTMQIENQPSFITKVAISNYSFNLLSKADMTRVYDVIISSGSTSLRPKAITAVNTIDNPVEESPIANLPPAPPITSFQLSPETAKYAVIAVVFMLILSTLS